MTAMLPTRPKYAREFLTFDQDFLDREVESGWAKVFPTAKGNIYVLKLPEGGSIKVTPNMITKVESYSPWADDDNAAEASLTDQDRYEAEADALGISVEEHTDGEYRDSRPSRALQLQARADRLDALGARWGL
jgi:hypothetical protein